MAGASEFSIVAQNSIIDVNNLLQEEWTSFRLHNIFSDDREALNWLARRKLVLNKYDCEVCANGCTLKTRTASQDVYFWFCNTCKRSKSVRHASFFSASRLPLQKIILLIYFWANQYQQKVAKHELEIGGSNTVSDWYNFCRDVCETDLVGKSEKIGGPGTIVEIDESVFSRRKYNRGRLTETKWVFGGIQRGTKKCFLVEVERRDADTLLPIIQQYIEPGTHIIHDGWRAYNNIHLLPENYTHATIIHAENFVDPANPETHTQSIESVWGRAKRMLRHQYGTSRELLLWLIKTFIPP